MRSASWVRKSVGRLPGRPAYVAAAYPGSECERGDSNPHGTRPRDPKSRASTNSATFAPRPGKINPVRRPVQSRGRPRTKGRGWQGPPAPLPSLRAAAVLRRHAHVDDPLQSLRVLEVEGHDATGLHVTQRGAHVLG